MTERKLTDEEFIKALEKALTDVDAPMGEHWGCGFLTTQNIKDTLDLINRQKAEIERLERIIKSLDYKNIEIGVIKKFENRLKEEAYPFPCAIGVEYAVSLRQISDIVTEMIESHDE